MLQFLFSGSRGRSDEGTFGKTAAAAAAAGEKVERRPEEFVISAEDLSNPFSVFGKPKTNATVAVAPKILEEERTNK